MSVLTTFTLVTATRKKAPKNIETGENSENNKNDKNKDKGENLGTNFA